LLLISLKMRVSLEYVWNWYGGVVGKRITFTMQTRYVRPRHVTSHRDDWLFHDGSGSSNILCKNSDNSAVVRVQTGGEFRPRQTRQLPRAVDLKGRFADAV
jgi:hypothetical protein